MPLDPHHIPAVPFLDMEPELDAAIAALSVLKNRCHKIRSAA